MIALIGQMAGYENSSASFKSPTAKSCGFRAAGF